MLSCVSIATKELAWCQHVLCSALFLTTVPLQPNFVRRFSSFNESVFSLELEGLEGLFTPASAIVVADTSTEKLRIINRALRPLHTKRRRKHKQKNDKQKNLALLLAVNGPQLVKITAELTKLVGMTDFLPALEIAVAM